MATKYFFNISVICLLLVSAVWASPVLCLDLNTHSSETYKEVLSDNVLSHLIFFKIDGHPVTQIRTWIRGTGLDEFLLKKSMISAELLNRHSDPVDSPLNRLKNTPRTFIKESGANNPATRNDLAGIYENMRSPVLAPYKYKTNNNSLLSIVVPFDATDHLMVAPVISYIFSLNGFDKYELNYRNNAGSDNKDNSVFYGGINVIYKF